MLAGGWWLDEEHGTPTIQASLAHTCVCSLDSAHSSASGTQINIDCAARWRLRRRWAARRAQGGWRRCARRRRESCPLTTRTALAPYATRRQDECDVRKRSEVERTGLACRRLAIKADRDLQPMHNQRLQIAWAEARLSQARQQYQERMKGQAFGLGSLCHNPLDVQLRGKT